MKRIFTILAFLLCVLMVNAQGIIVRKSSQKQPTTQTTTATKNQTAKTTPAKKTSAPTSSTNSNRQRILQELADHMVYVQGGTFTMGATNEQGSDAEDREKPAHNVTLSSYYIGKTTALSFKKASHFQRCCYFIGNFRCLLFRVS